MGPTEKKSIDDAADVARYTGSSKTVARHIPWDTVDDFAGLAAGSNVTCQRTCVRPTLTAARARRERPPGLAASPRAGDGGITRRPPSTGTTQDVAGPLRGAILRGAAGQDPDTATRVTNVPAMRLEAGTRYFERDTAVAILRRPPLPDDRMARARFLRARGHRDAVGACTRASMGSSGSRRAPSCSSRPGVSHEYRGCEDLIVYNCLFRADLDEAELMWAFRDGHLGVVVQSRKRVDRPVRTGRPWWCSSTKASSGPCLPHSNRSVVVRRRPDHGPASSHTYCLPWTWSPPPVARATRWDRPIDRSGRCRVSAQGDVAGHRPSVDAR